MNLPDPIAAAQFLSLIFLAILFIQSGTDKVFDWNGNLKWLQGHFKDTPLSKVVSLMLGTVTLFELLAGVVSLIGAIWLLISGNREFGIAGAVLAAVTLIMLFFGQRMAKDYEGAATLVIYFIMTMVTLGLLA